MWWILVGILIVILIVILIAVLFSGSNSAVGYTREHGYCPNMGACEKCDLYEED